MSRVSTCNLNVGLPWHDFGHGHPAGSAAGLIRTARIQISCRELRFRRGIHNGPGQASPLWAQLGPGDKTGSPCRLMTWGYIQHFLFTLRPITCTSARDSLSGTFDLSNIIALLWLKPPEVENIQWLQLALHLRPSSQPRKKHSRHHQPKHPPP